MRTDDFATTVAALWRTLEIGAPRLEHGAEVVLSIDDMNITLADSPDERRLMLTASAGRLHENYAMRAEQVRTLLRRGLAFLLVSRACLHLRDIENNGLTVVVQATYPYERHNLAELVKLIHEVLQVLEFARSELSPVASAGLKGSLPSNTGDSVIFLT